jgi:probable HAF family extracellular repeat protein
MSARRHLGISLAVFLGLTLTVTRASAQGSRFDFTYPIDAPGATSTQLTGIDGDGNMVGTYTDSGGASHGFSDRGGKFVKLDVPYPTTALTGAYGTFGLNGIVGRYLDGAGEHGFHYTGVGFLPIDVPYTGVSSTDAFGINTAGSIVGTYTDEMGRKHGFLDQAGNFSPIDFPGAISTLAWAINNPSAIVGWYADVNFPVGIHGFIEEAGTFTAIDVPGATLTQAYGINDFGSIVGTYVDSSGTTHGFLDQGGTFTPIDIPGADWTRALAIDNTGGIVGVYADSAGTHGFEVPPAESLGDNQISISSSGVLYSRVSKTYNVAVTIQNISFTSIRGPFQVVLNLLPAGVTVLNPSGIFNGNPYLTLALTTLGQGQSAAVTMQFSDPTNAPIHFLPVIFSGSFH